LPSVADVLKIRPHDQVAFEVGQAIEAVDADLGVAVLEALDLAVFGRHELHAPAVDDAPFTVDLHHRYAVVVGACFLKIAIVHARVLGDVVKAVLLVACQAQALTEAQEAVHTGLDDELSVLVHQARFAAALQYDGPTIRVILAAGETEL
jgi:hypothetical protein